jgi:hypothetical protein
MQVRWVYGVLAVLGVQCASSVLTLHAQARPAAPAAAKGQTHPAPVAKTPPPRRADGQPNLEGVWDYRTLTPLERSREFAEKEFLTEEEVADLDGRPHLPSNIRRWLGDSRGRWDGETLVVETANFPDKVSFRGASSHLRMVERFTRIDADMLDYRFTLEDPTTWTRPWTVSLPMTRSPEEVYEYACHEGNYGLENILRNARAGEPPPR